MFSWFLPPLQFNGRFFFFAVALSGGAAPCGPVGSVQCWKQLLTECERGKCVSWRGYLKGEVEEPPKACDDWGISQIESEGENWLRVARYFWAQNGTKKTRRIPLN